MVHTSFTFSTCRSLKRFIGSATAAVAANEVALRHTVEHLDKGSNDAWASLARQYKIRVDGIKSDEVQSTSARLHIVSIYAGFDRFLRALRKEWAELSATKWLKDDGDGPFQELIRNAPSTKQFEHHVPKPIRDCVEHYRRIRNATTHPCDETENLCSEHYLKNESSLSDVGKSYGMTGAPHGFWSADFHDAKLLAQLSIDVSKQISNAFDPGDEALAKAVPAEFRSYTRGTLERAGNRLGTYLRTRYGLSSTRAGNIVARIYPGPLA